MRHPDNFPWIMFWILTVIVIVSTSAAGQTCAKGWFGENCQYKCHHTNGNCTGSCEPGWFGIGCQYADLMFTHGAKSTPQVLRDGNHDTCITDQNLQSVTLSLTQAFPVTWLRLNSKNKDLDLLLALKVQLLDSKGQIVTCSNMRKILYNGEALDVYCDGDGAVQEVTLIGDGVKSLCTVSFSGGRNIALKQPATQSSLYPSGNAELAVDGNTAQSWDWKSNSCAHTKGGDPAPYWRVHFSHPRMVNRYVLYNRLDCSICPERLRGFILTSHTEDNQQVFQYKDREKQAQAVYTITSVGITTPVSYVGIRVTQPRGKAISPVLTLCEVEIYGDCPHPTYGEDCQETCSTNCVDQRCNFDNGTCHQCPPGRIGDLCDQECPQSYYGQDCAQRCSSNCVDQRCDSVSGVCDQLEKSCGQDGQVFLPENVAFLAQVTNGSEIRPEGERIVYDRVLINGGNGYDPQTGVFTCPVAGLYEFNIHALTNFYWMRQELKHNGQYITSVYGFGAANDNELDSVPYETGGNTAILKLEVGDKIDVTISFESKLLGEPNIYYATFSGFLIPKAYTP